MKSTFVLPIIYLIFASISLTILQSIAPALVQTQAVFFLIGTAIFFVTSFISFNQWKMLLPLMYTGIVAALALTLVLGNVTRGSTRWISIGSFNFQPSQYALPIIILFVSYLLSRFSLKKLQNMLLVGILTIIPLLLIFIEPDLDTSIVLIVSLASLIFMSDLPRPILLAGMASTVAVAFLAWTFFLQPYQRERVFSFLEPSDPQDSGYNAIQSKIAIGSGQLFGRGLGHGVQSQLRFLPERQTDFIFASLAEETGFVGGSLVISVYLLLILFIIRTMNKTQDPFKMYTLLGLATLICFQVFVNIGMNIGILPVAGLTLPYISYGGSSLLAFSFALGIIQRIVVDEKYSGAKEIR